MTRRPYKSTTLRMLVHFVWARGTCETLPDVVVLFDFELMLNSLVNSYCHIETMTPFYGTFVRKPDTMASKQCFKYVV